MSFKGTSWFVWLVLLQHGKKWRLHLACACTAGSQWKGSLKWEGKTQTICISVLIFKRISASLGQFIQKCPVVLKTHSLFLPTHYKPQLPQPHYYFSLSHGTFLNSGGFYLWHPFLPILPPVPPPNSVFPSFPSLPNPHLLPFISQIKLSVMAFGKKGPGWKRCFPPNTSVEMSSKVRLLNEAACLCPHTVVFTEGFIELSQVYMASSSVQLAECNWKVWGRWVIVRLMFTLEMMGLGYRTAYPLLHLLAPSQTQSPITLIAHHCLQIPLPSSGVACVPSTQPVLSLHPSHLPIPLSPIPQVRCTSTIQAL